MARTPSFGCIAGPTPPARARDVHQARRDPGVARRHVGQRERHERHTNRRVEPLIRERVAAYGMLDRLHGFAFLDTDLATVSRCLTNGDRGAVDAVVGQVAELESQLRAEGADVVATGSGLLDVLLRTRGSVGEHHESTLLSPIAAAVNAARTAAAMSAGGVQVGTPSPDAAEVARYMARVDRLVAMDSADTPD